MKRKVYGYVGYARLQIPVEIQNDLDIKIGDIVDFSIDNGNIMVRPVRPSCKENAQVGAQQHTNAGEPHDRI